MSQALTASQRDALKTLVGRARRLLEVDLGARAAGTFGIDPDGRVAEADELRLDASALVARADLTDVLQHLRSEGETSAGAVTRLLRETVFTHLNRLVAIRVAEAHGFLPASLATGRLSAGYRDFLELAPLLAGDDTGGYWHYLQACGDELAADNPALFDPRNPLLALSPGRGALDELVELFAANDSAGIWSAPDALGWVYQFFNTQQERGEMHTSSAPRSSRELAVRNQFFTPRYVVDFLAQNTLGRRLVEAGPAPSLADDLPFLAHPPSTAEFAITLDSVSVLDPACGSGHFLLAAYDILERAWEHDGTSARDAAPGIVARLWGIDIDPRCAQVASAALTLRARRSCPDLPLPRPKIICARPLPTTTTGLPEFLAALPGHHRALVGAMTDALAAAPVLGPLLKAEERLDRELRSALLGGESGAGTLAQELEADALTNLDREVLDILHELAGASTASAAELLLAAEAEDALRFVEAVRRRYDAVLMNPPFGEPVPETKDYLQRAYPWLPSRTNDLLAAFVGRGLELTKPGGYVGAVTNRTAFFLKTFENWRRDVVLANELVATADLGFGVMSAATVEAAAYVVGRRSASPEHQARFLRLLKDTDRDAALLETAGAARRGLGDRRVIDVRQEDFHAIPQHAFSYAMGPETLRLIRELPRLEGNGGQARQGLATGDDFRFVRAAWEVDPREIARTRDETRHGKRWVPLAKGGEYGPYWSDIHLVVEWRNDGEALRAFPGSVIRNDAYYFRPGVTWPLRTNSGVSFRVLPRGCIFSHKGPSLIAEEPSLMLGWLNSRPIRMIIDVTSGAGDETRTGGVPSRSYEVGMIQALPTVAGALSDPRPVERAAERIGELLAEEDRHDETARRFVAPTVLHRPQGSFRARVAQSEQERLRRAGEALARYADLDEHLTTALGLDELAIESMTETVGPLVARLPDGAAPDREDGARVGALLTAPLSELIAAATTRLGMARYVRLQHQIADRRLETTALATGRPPDALIRVAEERSLLPPEALTSAAHALCSYLIGVAFGRWDVRVGRDPSSAPAAGGLFDPVAVCSPGLLVGADGLPSREAPANYPLALPPARVLADEPGHDWDITHRVSLAASVLSAEAEEMLADALTVVGAATLRDYVRRTFFKQHIAQYTKSRRKAPIYWPLYIPSRRWGVWAYAPALTRETLYAIASAAAQRESAAEHELGRLERERDAGGSGRTVRDVADALDRERAILEDVRAFRREAERVAAIGWEPTLDDGAVLCAAPLAELLVGWKEPDVARAEIRNGNYPWASVARWSEYL